MPLSPSHSALAEEAQQLPIVRNGRRNVEVIDARRAESPRILLAARRRAPRHIRAPQVDESQCAGLRVRDLRQSTLGESLLARIADGNGNDIMPPVQSPH